MKNRVYQFELEDGEFVVAKFYRPQRWSSEAILEEHAFSRELVEQDLSVVAPLDRDGTSLFEFEGYQFAVYPRQGGHPPNLENVTDLEVLARAIARIHAVGAVHDFQHRVALTSQRMGHDSRDYLLQQSFIPDDVIPAYDSVTQDLLALIDQRMSNVPMQRIHGDCHMGNVLWRDQTPHFVDFDDCMMGPPIQDLWMLLSGDRAEQTQQLSIILDAYIPFCDFAVETLALIEVLRTLRIMYHASWIARRWQDPAFPAAFTWFDSPRYWSEHLLSLREQQALLSEPPLVYL